MTDLNKTILELIEKKCNVNEICKYTKLSSKQLFFRLNMLGIKGYQFDKKYYYNGDIKYVLIKDIGNVSKNISIITQSSSLKFKAIVVSDFHIGNKNENIKYINLVYEFAKKNGINIILNTGDLIDGISGYKSLKKISSIEEQLEYLLKVFPFDKNILNFICFGNHDIEALKDSGQDLQKILLSKRHDIVPTGYGLGKVNIKNDFILLKHPETKISFQHDCTGASIILNGHTHQTKYYNNSSVLDVYVPSLSDLKFQNTAPGFMIMTINFTDNGLFKNVLFEQFLIGNIGILKVSESFYDLLKEKKDSHEDGQKVLSKKAR